LLCGGATVVDMSVSEGIGSRVSWAGVCGRDAVGEGGEGLAGMGVGVVRVGCLVSFQRATLAFAPRYSCLLERRERRVLPSGSSNATTREE
jgi:hypothetical protein